MIRPLGLKSQTKIAGKYIGGCTRIRTWEGPFGTDGVTARLLQPLGHTPVLGGRSWT